MGYESRVSALQSEHLDRSNAFNLHAFLLSTHLPRITCTGVPCSTEYPTTHPSAPPSVYPTALPTAAPTHGATTDIWFGPNPGGSGPNTFVVGYCELVCPSTVDQSNWLSPDANDDSFQVVVSARSGGGSDVEVARIGDTGWGTNLG
jgi:hypothetical protein